MNADVICAECGHFAEEHWHPGTACTRVLAEGTDDPLRFRATNTPRVWRCDCQTFTPLSAVLA